MEANLVGGEVAKPKREFPYANWGPWPAVFAVLIALCVGLFLSVPALIVGSQNGKIEALFPPSYSSGASFDKGDLPLPPGKHVTCGAAWLSHRHAALGRAFRETR